MRQFWLLLFIAPFLFLSCSEDNQTPESPADADDNFITSVVMTVASWKNIIWSGNGEVGNGE